MRSVKMYSNHATARVWVVRVAVATSLAVALDATNASAVMVVAIDDAVADDAAVVAAVANHAVDRPFSVNPNPKYHNRAADVVIVPLLHADGHDDGHDDVDAQNLNNDEMMEYHFQYRPYYD